MGISSTVTTLKFDGVLSTDNTVIQNLEMLCSAAGSFFTYDSNRGQWAVVINRAAASVASFDDSNILSSINLTSTGLLDLHNSVRVNYPRDDLNDVRDFVRYEIAAQDRLPNEPDSELILEYDIFHDPVQADFLAITTLKQSRMDLVIQFSTTFNSIGVRPGDVIDVTSVMYGFDQKKFRITSVAETDSDDGNIVLEITALEYSDSVYDLSDLNRFSRSDLNGISAPGEIGAPATPIITVDALAARPRVLVTTAVPGNAIVERMQLWYSTNNQNFELVSTLTHTDTVGKFTVGSAVEFEHVPPDTGSIFYRVRGVNSVTTGAFSATAQGTFNPTQVTDAIGPNTEILDNNNESIARQLALSALLSALDGFLNGNSNMNTVFEDVFDLLFGESIEPVNEAVADAAAAAAGGGQILNFQRLLREPQGPDAVIIDEYEFLPTSAPMSFTITKPGNYLLSLFVNFGKSGGFGFDVQDASIEIRLFTGGTPGSGTGVPLSYTGTSYSGNNVFDDLDCHATVPLTPGTYHARVVYYVTEATFLKATVVVAGPAVASGIEGGTDPLGENNLLVAPPA